MIKGLEKIKIIVFKKFNDEYKNELWKFWTRNLFEIKSFYIAKELLFGDSLEKERSLGSSSSISLQLVSKFVN